MMKPLENLAGVELDNLASWYGIRRRNLLFNLGEGDGSLRRRVQREQKVRQLAKRGVRQSRVWAGLIAWWRNW